MQETDLESRLLKLEEMAASLETLKQQFAVRRESLQPEVDKWLQDLAGPELRSMLSGPSAAEEYLADADVRLRIAALHLLVTRWRLRSDRYGEVAESIAFGEHEPSIRVVAFALCSNCLPPSALPRIQQQLVMLIDAELQVPEVRLAAYQALVYLSGRWRNGGPEYFNLTSLESIDWNFVNEWRLDAHSDGQPFEVRP